MVTTVVRVQFDRLGSTPGKLNRPDNAVHARQVTVRTTGPHLAAIVSELAGTIQKSIADRPLRVRITTPDGRAWPYGHFYVEDAETHTRYGYGLLELLTDGKREDLEPWKL